MEKKTITPGTRMRIAASRHMRQDLARMKDHAKNLMDDGVETPDEYAIDRTRYAAVDAAYSFRGSARSAMRKLQRRRDMLQRRADVGIGANNAPDVFNPASEPMEEAIPGQKRAVHSRRVHHGRQPFAPDTPNGAPDPGNGYHQKMRNHAVQRMKKAAQNAKRAAQTQRAAQGAKYSSEAAAKVTGKTAAAVGKAVQAIIECLENLTAALTAGGGAAVAVVVVLCIIGLLVSSAFGIFFAGEDTGNGMSIRTSIREINAEYSAPVVRG